MCLPEALTLTRRQIGHEYNPDLRTEANSQAVQDALDYFSFKVGLGTHHYQFNAGNIATATQYTGDRQDMVQHANRHQIKIEAALLQILHSILWVGKNLVGADIDPDTAITINLTTAISPMRRRGVNAIRMMPWTALSLNTGTNYRKWRRDE